MDRNVPQQDVAEDRFAYHQSNDNVRPPAMTANWDRESNETYRSASAGSRQVGNITINGDVYINNQPARYSEAYRELAPMSREMMADMQPWTVPSGDNIQPRQVGRVAYYNDVERVGDYRSTGVEVYGPRTGVVINDTRATSGVVYGPDGRVYQNGYQRDGYDDALRTAQVLGTFLGIAGVARDIFDNRGHRGNHHRGGYDRYDRYDNRGGYYDRGGYDNYQQYNYNQNQQWQQQRQQQNWYMQQQMQQRRMQSNCYPQRCR